ncbi:hypothetical protein EJB05_24864, partial [Eragrostis curvula]
MKVVIEMATPRYSTSFFYKRLHTAPCKDHQTPQQRLFLALSSAAAYLADKELFRWGAVDCHRPSATHPPESLLHSPFVISMAAAPIAAAVTKPATDHAGHPLLADEANNAEGEEPRNPGWTVPWLTILGFAFLTFNSVMAIIRSQGDTMAIVFVGFSYADLVLLFACLRMYERAPAGSSTRGQLKVAVWILTTLLTFTFSYKVAAVMPPPVALVVWLMAFATVAGGFFAFFLYKEKN